MPRIPARPALLVASLASIVAGLVHVAAAANHEGGALLAWMFALSAVAQIGWGIVVAWRPLPRLLLVGLVVNGGAVLVWALTRSVGIPFVASLANRESVGSQDLGAALWAGASALGSLRLLARPGAPGTLRLRGIGIAASVALVAALPTISSSHEHDADHAHTDVETASDHAPHDHEEADEATAHGGDHATDEDHDDHTEEATHTDHTEEADHADHTEASESDHDEHSDADGHDTAAGDLVGHGHPEGEPDGGDSHEHPDPDEDPHDDDAHEHEDPDHDPDSGVDPDDDPHDHDDDDPDPDDLGPIISLDDPRLTQEQWNAAVALIVATTSGMSGLLTEADVLAAGYESIGDGVEPGDYEHFVNWSYLGDEFELDAPHVESVVMKINADGTKRVVAGMYILTTGTTMDDAPELAGELTTWHDHDTLCFEGEDFVGLAIDGVCAVGAVADTPPMLHVWIEANDCGPFAAIDEHGMQCEATHPH